MSAPRLRVVGPGRAGGALAVALGRAGWQVLGLVGRGEPVDRVGDGADLVVIATPDAVIPEVAAAILPQPDVVVAHLAGSLGLEVLDGHPRTAAIHPLVALPDADRGADRLIGAWYAVAGDQMAARVVADLGGRSFTVADADRVRYHAAAVVASNHLVALLGSADRIAAEIGVPRGAYIDLAAATLANVAELGPAAALTGPAARGDWATVARHLAAIPEAERDAYRVLADAARRLVDADGLPPDLGAR